MARTATGSDALEQAQHALREAEMVEEPAPGAGRSAAAAVAACLSIEQTAAMQGVSVGWACQLRRRFVTAGNLVRRTRPAQGLRACLSQAEEEVLLEPFVERARKGQIVMAAELRAALEQRLASARRYPPSTLKALVSS